MACNSTLSIDLMQGIDTLVCRNEGVMDLALAMHDSCLRSVLHNHQGYEVALHAIYHSCLCICGTC